MLSSADQQLSSLSELSELVVIVNVDYVIAGGVSKIILYRQCRIIIAHVFLYFLNHFQSEVWKVKYFLHTHMSNFYVKMNKNIFSDSLIVLAVANITSTA